jgi:hypothetical protein
MIHRILPFYPSSPIAHHRGRLILASILFLGLWFPCYGQFPSHAAEKPDQGGIVARAGHEGMPDFDIHYQSSYIVAQPIGPIY